MSLGVIGELLSNPKTERKVYDTGIAGEGAGMLDRLRAGGTANLASESEYDKLLKTAAGKVRGFEDMDIATLSNMLNKGGNRDFLGDYRSALGIGSDWFDRVSGITSGYNSRFDKQLYSDLGYGGRPTNSFIAKVSADRQSKNNVPLLQSIINGAPGVAGMANSTYLQNLGAQLGLMDQRAAIPYRGTMNPVSVANFRNDAFDREIGQFSELGRIQRENVAGFETKDNKWANAFAEAQRNGEMMTNMGLQALSSVASMYSGGMGGGMGGAAPAAATAGSPAIAAAPSFYTPQPMSYAQPAPSPMNYTPAANWATQTPPWYAPSFGWNSGYAPPRY